MYEINDKSKELIKSFMHELKTPLSIVRSHLESEIGNENLSLSLRKRLVLDVEELARLNNLLNEMNFLLDSKKHCKIEAFHKESLLSIAMDLIEFLEPLAEEKEQSISFITRENIQINMNKEKFQQLLLNLLSNALKYTPNKGKIHLELSQNSKEILIEVRDTGIGMTAEEIEQIFKPFYRVNKIRTAGTGLGLIIAQTIAKEHNIEISIKSEPNKGSSFFLHIPKV
jgi:signal transduction histidine kinase